MSVYFKITLLMVVLSFVSKFFAQVHLKIDIKDRNDSSNAYLFWGTINLLSNAIAIVFAVITIIKA